MVRVQGTDPDTDPDPVARDSYVLTRGFIRNWAECVQEVVPPISIVQH